MFAAEKIQSTKLAEWILQTVKIWPDSPEADVRTQVSKGKLLLRHDETSAVWLDFNQRPLSFGYVFIRFVHTFIFNSYFTALQHCYFQVSSVGFHVQSPVVSSYKVLEADWSI